MPNIVWTTIYFCGNDKNQLEKAHNEINEALKDNKDSEISSILKCGTQSGSYLRVVGKIQKHKNKFFYFPVFSEDVWEPHLSAYLEYAEKNNFWIEFFSEDLSSEFFIKFGQNLCIIEYIVDCYHKRKKEATSRIFKNEEDLFKFCKRLTSEPIENINDVFILFEKINEKKNTNTYVLYKAEEVSPEDFTS